MPRVDSMICLYLESITDLQKAIELAKKASYTRVITRVTNPLLGQSETRPNVEKHNSFTRSDLLLEGDDWRNNTVLKIGEFSECDSRNNTIRKQSKKNLKQEIDWAKHLSAIACVMVQLKDDETGNLSRQLLEKFDHSGCVLAEIPIIDKSFFDQKYTRNTKSIKLSQASADIWQCWNKFRFSVDFNPHFKIALELTSILPSEAEISRWFGEPVEMIILTSDMFETTNNNNHLVLKECYKEICLAFLVKTGAHFAVRCMQGDPWINSYPKYLRSIFGAVQKKGEKHECNQIHGYKAGLKLPFTPECSMNACSKYERVMHNIYKKAIQLAIQDLEHQSEEKINLMICGLNGWKLLEVVMSIIAESSAKVQVFVFREDSCAYISINEVIEQLYPDKNITLLTDTKNEQYHKMMDIVVSITSEAVYESQWLQFNFDRVEDFIHPDAILIPHKSTLTIIPVTAAKVSSYLYDGAFGYKYREPINGMETYGNRAQTLCPLFTRNLYECGTGYELFSFNYLSHNENCVRIQSDSRIKRLTFTMDRDCVVTGFCGYFDATLYKNITLNNRTMIRNENEHCIPMAYFPLKTPQSLAAQTELKTMFWLHQDVETHKYWYEWELLAPNISMIHNLGGGVNTLQPMAHS